MKRNVCVTNEQGFTLLEVLVALALFAFVTAGIAPALLSTGSRNKLMESKTGAIHAAQRVLDELRFQDPSLLPSTGTGETQDVVYDSVTYKVTPHYCEDTTYCDNDTRSIRVEVTLGGIKLYEVQTVYTKLR